MEFSFGVALGNPSKTVCSKAPGGGISKADKELLHAAHQSHSKHQQDVLSASLSCNTNAAAITAARAAGV
jgi:hypothetical protein